MSTEVTPDLSDSNRCVSVHWSLPIQCDLPCTHRENWHEVWSPETGDRLRYRRSMGIFRTEEWRGGVWVPLDVPPPDDDRRELATLRAERDALKAAVADVRRLQELTIAASCRIQAIDQATDTLAVLDRALAAPESNADAPSPVSTATEVSGGAREAQEG